MSSFRQQEERATMWKVRICLGFLREYSVPAHYSQRAQEGMFEVLMLTPC